MDRLKDIEGNIKTLISRINDGSWITVAQFQKYKKDGREYDLTTTSILAETDSKHILSDARWITYMDFGNPEIWERHDGKNDVCYNENSVVQSGSIMLKPFVILRSWPRQTVPEKFELIQDFILFYNLFFEKDAYKAYSNTGEEICIVKMQYENDMEKIQIHSKYLRNYLAFKNRILVRQHDFFIHYTDTLEEMGLKSCTFTTKNDSICFETTVNESDLHSDFGALTRSLGKDLVLPLEQKKNLLGWDHGYCKFIIGVDDQENNVEFSCKQENMSSKRFFTPVFFKRDVLQRYYDEPSRFTIEYPELRCGGHWSIPIDINSAGLVQVWLGDLAKLPHTEQLHWKTRNVLPEGGVTESRKIRDFYAEFADPDDPISQFKKSLSVFEQKFENKFGFRLFVRLGPDDLFIKKGIRIPLTDEIPEFEMQIGYLAKLLPESIDISAIVRNLEEAASSDEIESVKGKKIKALEKFLMHHNMSTQIIKYLHTIQDIRSSGVAHPKGKKYANIVKKHDIDGKYSEFIKKMVEKITVSLNDLGLAVSRSSTK